MNDPIRVVAVSQRVVDLADRGEVRDCLDQQWTAWLLSVGLRAIPVPNRLDSVVEFLNAVRPSGVVLTGGNNLTLPVYNEARPQADAFRSRDETERALVDYARHGNLPVLGCCRGMQFLNAYFGGRLSRMESTPVKHVRAEHELSILGERFHALTGGAAATVNSFHDFGLTSADLAPDLVPFAICPGDSTVEAFIHRSAPIIGIMWHPERRNPAAAFDRNLATQLFHSARANHATAIPIPAFT